MAVTPEEKRALLQDECKGLSIALSQAPHARLHATEAAAAITRARLHEEALEAASMEFLSSLPPPQFAAIRYTADTKYAIGEAIKRYATVAGLKLP